MFRKILDTCEAGDNIGALLRGVERTDIESTTGILKADIICNWHILNLKLKLMFLKKEECKTTISLQNIDLSFILEQLMLQEK